MALYCNAALLKVSRLQINHCPPERTLCIVSYHTSNTLCLRRLC